MASPLLHKIHYHKPAVAGGVKLHKEIMRIILPILLIISSFSASAIVVRHDVNDKKYLADVTDFSPLATLYIDGAHGTLIKPEWIVTAAHATFCISPGSYIRLNNGYHKVENVFVHKDYQPGKSHDIALIKVSVTTTTPCRMAVVPINTEAA